MSPLTQKLMILIKLIQLKDWKAVEAFVEAMSETELIIGITSMHSLERVEAGDAYRLMQDELELRNRAKS